jgi:hypothetical protein
MPLAWVKSEFDRYALESNGRLTSKIDYFTKADGRRIADEPIKWQP